MGNFLSCTLAKAPGGRRCARVILSDGGVKQVSLPATAAELMMDAPGHFLVDARGAALGTRLAALPADEDLELGGAYATFPMKRLGTALAAADVARLAAAATREARRSAKVSSSSDHAAVVAAAGAVASEDEEAPRLRLEEMVVDDAAAVEIGVLKHRLSNARSRRPTLETIVEENYLSSRA